MKVIFKEFDGMLKLTILRKIRANKFEIFRYEYNGYQRNNFVTVNLKPELATKLIKKISKTITNEKTDRVFGKRFKKVAMVARKCENFSQLARKGIK